MSKDKATAAETKAALAQVIKTHPDGSLYTFSVAAFEQLYGRKYSGKLDRAELERIKWHAKRLLAGESGEWGGKRDGAGHRKQAQEVSE